MLLMPPFTFYFRHFAIFAMPFSYFFRFDAFDYLIAHHSRYRHHAALFLIAAMIEIRLPPLMPAMPPPPPPPCPRRYR